ncbi:hypothetical protein tb265_32020 [Gemmatimonadetes bacterium T265]|nr:hypothetical protein tb265_32020 [Gemmatimonadetes bacterium T265]
MPVLFYHPDAVADGRARAFVAGARGLADAGWRVALATHAAATHGAAALAAAQGIPVLTLPPSTTLVGATAELSRAIRTHLAEVVFVHGERAHVVAAGAAWRAQRSAVVRRVGAGEALTFGASARAALRAAATGVLCTWPEQASAVPARAALGAVVADLGVPERAPAHDGPGCRVRCTVAPGAELRAALVLRVAAMIAPRHRDLELAFVGPGVRDEALAMHAAALGIRHRVTWHETLPADAPDPDVAWVAAGSDDGAFAALDAMAAGVPVLAERGSAPARYVADGITGLHLIPGDVPASAAVLARLLGQADARAAMGAAGRSRARRAYAESAMVDGFARAVAAARDRTRWRR